MNEGIRVRYFPADDTDDHASEGAQEELLDIRNAARVIAQRKAEPVISVKHYAPLIPLDGLSLKEAFDLHVTEHPNVLEHGDPYIRYPRLLAQDFVDLPTWENLASLKKLREVTGVALRGSPRVRRPGNSWMGEYGGRRENT